MVQPLSASVVSIGLTSMTIFLILIELSLTRATIDKTDQRYDVGYLASPVYCKTLTWIDYFVSQN